MAQESPAAKLPWWELPKMPRRPQYLLLRYIMAERQPTGSEREAELHALRD